jgi:hypothetical protein
MLNARLQTVVTSVSRLHLPLNRTKMHTEWIESAGGPLLLLPHPLASRWRGTDPNGHPVSGDYARACAQPGFLSRIDVPGGFGIVLGGEPLPTAWWAPITGASGAVVRWEYADDDEAVAEVLEGTFSTVEVEEQLEFRVTSPLQLFDSAWPGNEAPKCLTIELPLGRYHVTSEWVRPSDRTSLLLHRFEMIPS